VGIALACSLAFTALPFFAWGAHVDVLIQRRGAAVEIGSFDFATSRAELPVRVFSGRLDPIEGGLAFGDTPGWTSIEAPPASYEALPSASAVTLLPARDTPLGALPSVWDGNQAFVPAIGHRLAVALPGPFGPVPGFEVTTTSTDADPFTVAMTDERGRIHQHLQFALATTGGDGAPPNSGIYVLPVMVGVGGVGESPPIYLLLNHGRDAVEARRAEEHLRQSVLGETPEQDAGCRLVGSSRRAHQASFLLVAVAAWLSFRKPRRRS
jgi:hypothetical protein